MSSRSSDDPGQEGVFDRRLYFCPRLQSFGVNELILTCPCCQGFFLYCCHCSLREGNLEDGPCHHYPLVLTDGACRNNGKEDATAGIGFVFGTLEDQQYGIPVTTDMDDFAKQTSQRAELLAAINGLQYMCEVTRANAEDALNTVNNPHKTIIVATDSQYVVSGITTWFPDWKVSVFLMTEQWTAKLISLARPTTGAIAEAWRQPISNSFMN